MKFEPMKPAPPQTSSLKNHPPELNIPGPLEARTRRGFEDISGSCLAQPFTADQSYPISGVIQGRRYSSDSRSRTARSGY
jgi:hypothetical protein